MEEGSQVEVNGGEFQGKSQWGFSSGDPWRDIQVKVNGGNFSGGSK